MSSTETATRAHILDVKDARVTYLTKGGTVDAVIGATMHVGAGEAIGLVGESGSGKSTLAASCVGMTEIRLLNRTPVEITGSVTLLGQEVVGLREKDWNLVRGRNVGYVSQDPFGVLNPVLRVHHHMDEALRAIPKRDRAARTSELLRRVNLPVETAKAFPHELSGGMRQRVAIAMAIANSPELLIADEPTTALDVTTQADILALLNDLRAQIGMAMLLISHDLGVVSQVCDRVYVMLRGEVVEQGKVADVLRHPKHPYTKALLRGARLERGPDGRFLTGVDLREIGAQSIPAPSAAETASTNGEAAL